MPRPSRFNPTFGERLRQSRVARGQEPEPTIPEPVATARDLSDFWRDIASVIRHARAEQVTRAPSIFEQAWTMPNEGCGLYRQLAEQMRRQVMQEAHEARVRGAIAHQTTHDEMLMDPRSITAPEQPPQGESGHAEPNRTNANYRPPARRG